MKRRLPIQIFMWMAIFCLWPSILLSFPYEQPVLKQEVIISIYPQPSNGMLRVSLPGKILEIPEIPVFDLLGNLLSHLAWQRESSSVFSTDMTGEKSGYYFIKITWGR
jgi:hypothetical protein